MMPDEVEHIGESVPPHECEPGPDAIVGGDPWLRYFCRICHREMTPPTRPDPTRVIGHNYERIVRAAAVGCVVVDAADLHEVLTAQPSAWIGEGIRTEDYDVLMAAKNRLQSALDRNRPRGWRWVGHVLASGGFCAIACPHYPRQFGRNGSPT